MQALEVGQLVRFDYPCSKTGVLVERTGKVIHADTSRDRKSAKLPYISLENGDSVRNFTVEKMANLVIL